MRVRRNPRVGSRLRSRGCARDLVAGSGVRGLHGVRHPNKGVAEHGAAGSGDTSRSPRTIVDYRPQGQMRVFTGECDQRTISDSVSRARRALLPNVPWADVDTMKRHRQRLKASTPRRETLFRALAEYGTDFIHKDAYWLAGPAALARRAGRLRPARLPGHRTREGTVRRPWFRALSRAFPVPRQPYEPA